ncbi:hypothetical protein TNCV_977561 [Trichonephila clavipes]|nr:hypothetical protein TNCV_977561 [Trichonephila clavipes]
MHQRSSVGDGRFLPTSSDVTNQWPGLVSRRCWYGTNAHSKVALGCILPTTREDDGLGVIGKVLAFVRNGRYSERTYLPSFIGDSGRDMNRTLRAPQSWRHLSTAKATKPSHE